MRKYSKLLCMLLIASLVVATPVPLKATVGSEKDKLSDLEKKKDDVQGTLDELESSKADTKTFIKQVDAQVGAISTQMYDNKNKLEDVQKKIKNTEKKLKDAQESIKDQYASMKLRIKFMYENGDTQMLDLILNSKSISDFLNKAEYISEISTYDREMLDKMEDTQIQIANSKKTLEDSKDNLVALQNKLESQKNDLEKLADAKEKELGEYDDLIAQGESAQNSLDEEIENQKQVVAEMESIEAARRAAAEAAAKAAQSNNNSSNSNQNTSSSNNTATVSGYTWPVPGISTISSGFGYRSDPFTGETKYHSGIDIPAPSGTPIVAAASGQVAWANYSTTAGNWIGIDHGNGVYTVYMHSSALLVSAGQNVSKGETIALVGTTGSSTGNHLHFSVRLNGNYVNPLNYVSY